MLTALLIGVIVCGSVVIAQRWPAPRPAKRVDFALLMSDGQGFATAQADATIVRVLECWHDTETGADVERHCYGARLRRRPLPRRA